ncbi:MAG: Uma2 family endonuclease [Pyrinomonadaceae bacterium]|jgi:Uma2 family endonuclease|nr:Uma2 family endonuclease [Pyrinomonadaceae bacterium]
MNWQEVTENPNLQNLPFKIELNEWGQIVMNPVKLGHSVYQGEIAHLMRIMRDDGFASPEVAIWTKKGTKVADVAWISDTLWKKLKGKAEADIAPEVCVEVISMSNSDAEMKQKRKLYFEQGASEIWICDEYGDLTFYNSKGKLKKSKMFPDFPDKIEI